MSTIEQNWHSVFVPILAGFLACAISGSVWADAASDYTSKCEGCHSSPPGPGSTPTPIDFSKFTNATLRTKINDDMPYGTPNDCVDDCAIDLANFLLSPSPGTLLVAKATESSNLVGTGPLDASFSGKFSDCEATPCDLEWDFGDGATVTQTTYDSRSLTLTPVVHTFTTTGSHRVTLTISDSAGQTDEEVLYAYVTTAESFASYVDTCKDELEFDDDDIPNDLNCTNGFLFADDFGAAENDFTDYRRITDQVDLVFACRWLQNGTGTNEFTDPPFILAASIEMLMHNRANGNTCFFRAQEHDMPLPGGGTRSGSSVEIVSPTVAAAAAPGTTEYEYWDDPLELAQSLPCVDCHVAGPYIASPRIAPFLQRFGLLNDGHDTHGRAMQGYFDSYGKYFAPGETLEFMNHFAAFNNEQNTCANGCHSIGYNSTAATEEAVPPPPLIFPRRLIPSISSVISGGESEISVQAAAVMPANDPPTGEPDGSHYTWINRDTPFSPGDEGDFETFADAKDEFPTLLSYCDDPGLIVAHAVDSELEFHPYQLPDKLQTFNVKDGLACINAAQDDGQCEDYRLRYQCTDPDGNKTWTNWYNIDSPGNSGDYENRSGHANVCTSPAGLTVTGIQAAVTLSNGWTYTGNGPKDRLARFDPHGLVCRNADQPNGQCSNYVVKFTACSDAPEPYTARISSAWSDRLLTATGTENNASTKAQPANSSWSSQDWTIEPVANTGYVRLKNVWSGRYLNTQSDIENADVLIYDSVADWGSQQWVMETISGSSDVRFRNVWTGRYLTVTDTGDYANIRSQSLNTGWASQRWRVLE